MLRADATLATDDLPPIVTPRLAENVTVAQAIFSHK